MLEDLGKKNPVFFQNNNLFKKKMLLYLYLTKLHVREKKEKCIYT